MAGMPVGLHLRLSMRHQYVARIGLGGALKRSSALAKGLLGEDLLYVERCPTLMLVGPLARVQGRSLAFRTT
jgi:hypothetical protein